MSAMRDANAMWLKFTTMAISNGWTIDIPDDEEDVEEEDEEDFLNDDELGDCIEWSPEEYWCSPDGVLTDEANEMLYTQDSKGELV